MDLEPCPFCGSRAEIVHASHIRCINTYNCDCETRLGPKAWNRRTKHPEAAPTWRLVQGDELPAGSPVDPGTTLYAFYLAPVGAHWEYNLPDVPTPQSERS